MKIADTLKVLMQGILAVEFQFNAVVRKSLNLSNEKALKLYLIVFI